MQKGDINMSDDFNRDQYNFDSLNMFPCSFCQNGKSNAYVYMLCEHFACLNCAALRTDQSFQTLKCCGKTTFLDADTIQQLINKNKQILQKLQTHDLQQEVTQINHLKTENSSQLIEKHDDNQMETILQLQIEKVKKEFEEQHRLLRERQTEVIKKILNVYQQQTGKIIIKDKISIRKERQDALPEPEPKTSNCYDGILKKLEINQQRMEAKLHKHTND